MERILLFVRARKILVGVSALVILIIILIASRGENGPTWTTDTVSTGSVRNLISVSGVIDAVDSAELSFPVSGTLESVTVKEGDVVQKGHVLATLVHNDLKADYRDAYGALLIARADRDELVNGLRPEERDITKTETEIAREDLARITKEQDERVKNARLALLSSDLEAKPKDESNEDTPPTIRGSYTCANEGEYVLDLYRSGSNSGFSYRLSGLESGIYTGYTESPGNFGACGLSIQFADGESYGNSEWTITIPNTRGASYVTNLNAYNLALTTRENAINEAKQKLALAEQNEKLDTASPRNEALTREEARVLQAEARLAQVEALIGKHILVAPFDGTVTHIDPVPGEALGTEPVITMVSESAFALTALVPEIDVTRITVGQKADVIFDARQSETLPATIIFISPLAKEVDGVSYFEAKLTLDNEIDWLRSGLNADVDILVETRENVTRIPRRYLRGEDGSYTVHVPDGDKETPVSVTVPFFGNDGYVEVAGVEAGTTIIAP